MLILRRVIISRNITFNENVFFNLVKHEKQAGQLISKVKDVIKAIEKDEIQDVELILKEIGLFNTNLIKTRALEEPSDTLSLLNSGVIKKANLL